MFEIQQLQEIALNIESAVIYRLIATLGIFLVIGLIKFIIIKVVNAKTQNSHTQYTWRKFTTYIGVTVGIILIIRVWFEAFSSVFTFLGLLSAGVAIALKDPIVNFFGWIFIIWRRPFHVGDRIEIGEHAGDVVDLRLFQFVIMEIGKWVDADQYTGRLLLIPNGKVFTDIKANYSEGFQYIWDELAIRITFESDWQKAKQIVFESADKHGEHKNDVILELARKSLELYMITEQSFAPEVYSTIVENGIELRVRFFVNIRRRRVVKIKIFEEIIETVQKQKDVRFAYSTTRVFIPEAKDLIKKQKDIDSEDTSHENLKE